MQLRKARKLVLRASAALATATLSAVIWIQASLAFPPSLPDPSGPYHVGRAEFDWVDESRIDPLEPSRLTPREIDAFVWYPAEAPGTNAAQYLRDNWLRSLHLPFPTPEYRRVRTHSTTDATMANPSAHGSTVVIVSCGFGARPTDYSSFTEDLASRGFVVAALANTYSGGTVVFPDGRVKAARSTPALDALVRVWADDIGTVVRQLSGLNENSRSPFYKRLNLSHVAIIGHSFGGAASAQFCSTAEICTCGIDMDGALYGNPIKKGIPKPFLFLLSDGTLPFSARMRSRTRVVEQASYRRYLEQDQAVCALSPDCLVQIEPGFRHMDFTDSAILFRPPLVWAHPLLGSIDGARAVDLVRTQVAQFLHRCRGD